MTVWYDGLTTPTDFATARGGYGDEDLRKELCRMADSHQGLPGCIEESSPG